MPDICMCKGEGCDLKANCYRYTATPNEWRQSYFVSAPCLTSDQCDHFSSNKEYESWKTKSAKPTNKSSNS
jgi:hypothetical protein